MNGTQRKLTDKGRNQARNTRQYSSDPMPINFRPTSEVRRLLDSAGEFYPEVAVTWIINRALLVGLEDPSLLIKPREKAAA